MISEQEFDAGWKHLMEQGHATIQRAKGSLEQAQARFLAASGWTQERIAEKIGFHRTRVHQLLLFGRFLDFVTPGNNPSGIPLSGLNEKVFRRAWSKTRRDSADRNNEKHRFEEVVKILQAQFQLDGTEIHRKRTPNVSKFIQEGMAGGHRMTDNEPSNGTKMRAEMRALRAQLKTRSQKVQDDWKEMLELFEKMVQEASEEDDE